MYRNATDFYILILYPAALPNSLMNSSSFLAAFLGFFLYIVSCHLQTVTVLLLLFQLGFFLFNPKTAEYTFFSSAHGTFSRIGHMLTTKQALVNLRKLKSYQASFPSSAMRLAKNTNTWRLNNMLLSDQ